MVSALVEEACNVVEPWVCNEPVELESKALRSSSVSISFGAVSVVATPHTKSYVITKMHSTNVVFEGSQVFVHSTGSLVGHAVYGTVTIRTHHDG